MVDWTAVRTLILAVGWPVLVLGSAYLVRRAYTFYRDVSWSSFGRLVFLMVLGWFVTMYCLGITATAFMWTHPNDGVPIVLPVFATWFGLMFLVGWSVGRWGREVAHVNLFYAKLNEANRVKSDLINRASHELSTPITPLKIQVELLKNPKTGTLSAGQRTAVAIIDRNVDRLAYLVHEMMDVARIQSGHLSMLRESLDLSDVLREVAKSFEPAAAAAGVDMTVNVTPRLMVEADPMRIAQVTQILLHNAIKFTPPGGHVEVTARLQYGRALVHIHDSGIGFRMDEVPRLFQPFGQLAGALQRTHAGSGLGLFIARTLVDAHAGSIWAESPGPGKGATFGFALPLQTTLFEEETASVPTSGAKPPQAAAFVFSA